MTADNVTTLRRQLHAARDREARLLADLESVKAAAARLADALSAAEQAHHAARGEAADLSEQLISAEQRLAWVQRGADDNARLVGEQLDVLRAVIRARDDMRARAEAAEAGVAALLHAYIGLTPGATVEGFAPEVQAAAERLLEVVEAARSWAAAGTEYHYYERAEALRAAVRELTAGEGEG